MTRAEFQAALAAQKATKSQGADLVEYRMHGGFVVIVEYRGSVTSKSDVIATYEAAQAEIARVREGLGHISRDYVARIAAVQS